MTTTEQIERVLTDFERVRQAITIEPAIMDVFEMAARGPYMGHSRWCDYDRLKECLYPLVGWGATNEQLTSSWLWSNCMTVIDYLLPTDRELDEAENPELARQVYGGLISDNSK